MPTPLLLTETMLEGTSGLYSFALVDLEGQSIDSAFLTSLTLTLYDVDSNQIVNNRLDQNIFNANDGTVTTTASLTPVTTVTFNLRPADTVILNEHRLVEYRVLSFRWTWDSGQEVGRHAVQFGIENLLDVEAGSPTPPGGSTHKYVTTFSNQSTIVIPGLQHGLATADLTVTVYDNAMPSNVVPVPYTVDPTTFDIVITVLNPMSGRVVVFG
jgi:hypothetical protein